MKYQSCLRWFSGKALERAQEAFHLLCLSEEEGQWIPGASRRVRAALTKPNVAMRSANCLKDLTIYLESSYYDISKKDPHKADAYSVWRDMTDGSIRRLSDYDYIRIKRDTKDIDGFSAVLTWASDFQPIAASMAELDSIRPKPVFTSIGVSPTITKTLKDAALDLDTKTIRICPHEYFRVKSRDKKGQFYWVRMMRLLWPKNTVFDASRHAENSTNGNQKCHACGHAIFNPFNWVPILIDGKTGIPYALWVGRDCSRTLFGIDVTGEIHIEGRGKTDGPRVSDYLTNESC